MDYTFPDQKEGEKVIRILRKHPATLLLPIIKTLIFLVPSAYILTKFNIPILVVLAFVIFTAALSYGLYKWVNWYGEIYMITTERVIAIFQKGIFNRKVAEVSLNKISDITFEINGVLATAFGFGTVRILSGSNSLDLENISDPRNTQTQTLDLIEKKSESSKKRVAEELVDLIKGKK